MTKKEDTKMSKEFIAFFLGLLLGNIGGFFIAALAAAAGQTDPDKHRSDKDDGGHER